MFWCAAPAPPPCAESVGCHYVTGVQLIAWQDAGHYPRLCFYSKLRRRRLIVNLLEETKPLQHLRASAGALPRLCVSVDAHLRETRHKVKACSHGGKPSASGLFVAFPAGDGVREGIRLQLSRGRKNEHRVALEGTKEEYLSDLSHVFLRRDFFSHKLTPTPPSRSHSEADLTLWGFKEVMMITT